MRAKILILAVLGLLVLAATALGKRAEVHLRAGDILVSGYGGFRPETLPAQKRIPISAYGGGKISTVSGKFPPALSELNFEFDRDAAVETRGLPVCTQGKLVATDVPAARRACGGAIVGKGFGKGVVVFPEQKPIPAGSGLTLFNGPKKHGNASVLVHFHIDVPAPTTFIVPVEIKRINKGLYGYRTEAKIPKIAGGYGIPLSGWLKIGRKWTYKGKKYSYVNARCSRGRLQAHVEVGFRDDTFLSGTAFSPCKVRN